MRSGGVTFVLILKIFKMGPGLVKTLVENVCWITLASAYTAKTLLKPHRRDGVLLVILCTKMILPITPSRSLVLSRICPLVKFMVATGSNASTITHYTATTLMDITSMLPNLRMALCSIPVEKAKMLAYF